MKPWERDDDLPPYPGDETVWFDTLAELFENVRNNNDSLNEIIGWSWDNDVEAGQQFNVTVAMPRARLWVDWSAPVTEADEPAVRAWLKEMGEARAARWGLPDD